MSVLAGYWDAYAITLGRVRSQRPADFPSLKAILDDFHHGALVSGDAFFPSGSADDGLVDALADAGWQVRFIEGDYWWEALLPGTPVRIEFIEGDVYDRTAA